VAVYLGDPVSCASIEVICLNHHQAFTRIRIVDRGLYAANLALQAGIKKQRYDPCEGRGVGKRAVHEHDGGGWVGHRILFR
jgi:hypothetical protein